MSKKRSTVEEVARNIAGHIVLCAIKASEQIEDVSTEKKSLFKRIFSRDVKRDKNADQLDLTYHLMVPHLAIAEYKLETENPFNNQTTKVIQLTRQISLQIICDTFKEAGCEFIDADQFVKEKSERFIIYTSTTRFSGNIVDIVMQDHELPHRMLASEVIGFLIKSRIQTYKELWSADEKRMHQAGFVAELPQKVYEYWKGEDPRNWETLKFNLLLSLNLDILNGKIASLLSMLEVS